MELLGRLCAVVGISLVLTLLLMVLHQEPTAAMPETVVQATASAPAIATP